MLLNSGVFIFEMNCVCKYLLSIKGGWLVVVCVLVWVLMIMISDVLGDDLVVIVFGFIVVDVMSCVDVLVICWCYCIELLFVVCVGLEFGVFEMFKFGDECLVW